MARRLHLAPPAIRWGFVLAVCAVILASSVTRPGDVGGVAGPLGIIGLDAWLHGLAYATLAGALAYALAGKPAGRVALLAVGGAVAFGLGIELLQSGIPYRAFSVADLLANALGASIVGLAWPAIDARVTVDRVSPSES